MDILILDDEVAQKADKFTGPKGMVAMQAYREKVEERVQEAKALQMTPQDKHERLVSHLTKQAAPLSADVAQAAEAEN